MNVGKLMHDEVVTVNIDDSLNMAARLFKEKNIRHLPVVDENGKLVGIFTDRDLKAASASNATLLEVHEMLYLLDKMKLSEVMTVDPFTADVGMTIKEAAKLMLGKNIGSLPVVNGDSVVGILTKADFVRYVSTLE